MKNELIDLVSQYNKNHDEKFVARFTHDKPMKHSSNEDLRWLFWMNELQKWLREKHNIHININYCGEHDDGHPAFRIMVIHNENKIECVSPIKDDWYVFRLYEEALEAGLIEALKLI
jgi:hypothetical protein